MALPGRAWMDGQENVPPTAALADNLPLAGLMEIQLADTCMSNLCSELRNIQQYDPTNLVTQDPRSSNSPISITAQTVGCGVAHSSHPAFQHPILASCNTDSHWQQSRMLPALLQSSMMSGIDTELDTHISDQHNYPLFGGGMPETVAHVLNTSHPFSEGGVTENSACIPLGCHPTAAGIAIGVGATFRSEAAYQHVPDSAGIFHMFLDSATPTPSVGTIAKGTLSPETCSFGLSGTASARTACPARLLLQPLVQAADIRQFSPVKPCLGILQEISNVSRQAAFCLVEKAALLAAPTNYEGIVQHDTDGNQCNNISATAVMGALLPEDAGASPWSDVGSGFWGSSSDDE